MIVLFFCFLSVHHHWHSHRLWGGSFKERWHAMNPFIFRISVNRPCCFTILFTSFCSVSAHSTYPRSVHHFKTSSLLIVSECSNKCVSFHGSGLLCCFVLVLFVLVFFCVCHMVIKTKMFPRIYVQTLVKKKKKIFINKKRKWFLHCVLLVIWPWESKDYNYNRTNKSTI